MISPRASIATKNSGTSTEGHIAKTGPGHLALPPCLRRRPEVRSHEESRAKVQRNRASNPNSASPRNHRDPEVHPQLYLPVHPYQMPHETRKRRLDRPAHLIKLPADKIVARPRLPSRHPRKTLQPRAADGRFAPSVWRRANTSLDRPVKASVVSFFMSPLQKSPPWPLTIACHLVWESLIEFSEDGLLSAIHACVLVFDSSADAA